MTAQAAAGEGTDGGRAILAAENVAKSFGGVRAIDGMSLSLASGSVTGLIGPNGAGKSTFFDVLSGVLRADAGRVWLMGEEVTRWPPHRRARAGLVRTFQLSRELGRLTVLENLMLSPQAQLGERLTPNFLQPAAVRRHDRSLYARAREVLDFVGLADLADALAAEVSGGQKKLLELGRALMIDSRVILLDEPGAGVNRTLMQRLVEIIRRINRERGVSFLIVEHDMDLIAALCDPVIVMNQGRALTSAHFADIRRDPRVIEAYLGGAPA